MQTFARFFHRWATARVAYTIFSPFIQATARIAAVMVVLLWAPAWSVRLCGQAFMRPADNAVALALGGAVVAYPVSAAGLVNEALPARLARPVGWAGVALPFALPEWQAVHLQLAGPLRRGGAAGFELAHAGTPAYGEQCLRLLYARRLAESIFLGVGVEALRVQAGEYGSAGGITASAGLLARVRPDLWLGARLHNPVAARLAGEPLPPSLRLGACWQAGPLFRLVAETEKRLAQAPQYKAGLEYSPLPALALRLGARTSPGRIAFGAALRLKKNVYFDAASEWHPALGVTPAAMLRIESERGRKGESEKG